MLTLTKKNRIHLISLLKNGDLVYSLNNEEKWSKNLIGKLDTKSNIYKYLNLCLIEGKINIFYTYANLINQNLWTIEQIIRTENRWTKIRVNTILSEKLPGPFYVDYDKFENIHLIFKARGKNSDHIYYTFYNSFVKKWNGIPEKISSSNTNNLFPYLFIDSKNNIHAIWSTLISKDYTLNYKKLTTMGQDKYRWKIINLPNINNINFTPIIIENNKILKIIFIKDDKINYLYSKDYGNSWIKSKDSYIITSNSWLIDYSSNFSEEHFNNKANNLYCKINNTIHSHPDNFYGKENNNQKITPKVSKPEKDLISDIYILTKDISKSINDINKDLDLLKKIIKNSYNNEGKKNLYDKTIKLF